MPDHRIHDERSRATYGEFTGYRFIKGTGSLRVEVDVPAEQVTQALQMLGKPGCWIALARMAEEPEKPEKESRRWEDLTPAQQAGIRCADRKFQEFITTIQSWADVDEEDAKTVVYGHCQIFSRKELVPGSEPARAWAELDDQFQTWLKYGDGNDR